MPGTVSDGPTVSMSFANNFWGKEDAGVNPLLERMHNAKTTSDELKAFYSARAAIEDEYSRKLLSLCRKPLGSGEGGTLRTSFDTVRGEVETMGKAHQGIAAQMKSELDEPLAAFAGGMKERRKIVQTGIEKLLKVKIQQTQAVNKLRDRYEQDCLRIKGYLAQGHMVMGQEERKNKAKLEKTQIHLATASNEYESAVKALEDTTGRWNREWKAACDKFQDLEEERLDFMKSSLWSFANIASTVCVSDDASCEKIRLSLENCEVEKDISIFIREKGTGQEIPDAPRYINFCRGDLNDSQSEASEDDSYSVAQFQRTINPAFRSSSPQPSTYESHHDPNSKLAIQMSQQRPLTPPSRETTLTPQKALQQPQQSTYLDYKPMGQLHPELPPESAVQLAQVPHNEYPAEGMTMYCRNDAASGRSSATSPTRPRSRDSHSDYSNPTSFSSLEPSSGKQSPIKPSEIASGPAYGQEEKQVQKKKSGFFQGHSPFRRKSKHEKESPRPAATSRNTWSERNEATLNGRPSRRSLFGRDAPDGDVFGANRQSGSPEPVDPRANFQLNVGNNVFDVASPDRKQKQAQGPVRGDALNDLDPIAQALAELKGVTKQSSVRMSADRYHGLQTPAPGASGVAAQMANGSLAAAQRGTPPPSYDQPMKRLDLPQPAFTSAQMQQTRQKYVDQRQSVFGGANAEAEHVHGDSQQYQHGSHGRSSSRGGQVRAQASSPALPRSTSPRPGFQGEHRQGYRSASPNPYGSSSRPRPHSTSPIKRGTDPGAYGASENQRPGSSSVREDQLQLSPGPDGSRGGSHERRGRYGGNNNNTRPTSYYGGHEQDTTSSRGAQQGSRTRSKSVADGRQFNAEGKQILHYARAMYTYQATIPIELSFQKGDILAILRLQEDGWWEAEVTGKKGRPGLVPSNYLQNC
ncbi:MAG: hypothetical protein M1825_002264 [Sarcosagium campestre]|nr:MAG: hypothetical protein M1825_002264 [Sarcosagium campestre]